MRLEMADDALHQMYVFEVAVINRWGINFHEVNLDSDFSKF